MDTQLCLSCGYDLRGSPTDVCPECGSVLDYDELSDQIARMSYPLLRSLGAAVLIAAGFMITSPLLTAGWLYWSCLLICYGFSLYFAGKASVVEAKQTSLRRAVMRGRPTGTDYRWFLAVMLFTGHALLNAVLLAIAVIMLGAPD